jgi:type VI secretion system FHA domain protein
MPLTLTMLRCPPSVALEMRMVTGGEFSIGRSNDNDWVLPDPEKEISRRHCVIAYRNGVWCVAGTSSNGTFVNFDGDPLESRTPHALGSGDRIRMGSYEIEVTLDESAHTPSSRRFGGTPAHGHHSPFDDDPFAQAPLTGSLPEAADLSLTPRSPMLPPDYDPLRPDEDELIQGPTGDDHNAATADAINLPTPQMRLPDDWNLEEVVAPAAPRKLVVAEAQQLPAVAPVSKMPVPASASARHPAAFGAGDSAAGAAELMAAFLRGAQLDDIQPADPLRTMEQLGAAFRGLVIGLRQAMAARAATKREFRIDATQILVRGNNPLKFAANDDDALISLLGTGRRSDMTAEQAVMDALSDICRHELAVMPAMQEAVRALVTRLGPERIQKEVDAAGGALNRLGNRKARAWESYEALHGQISKDLADNFDSVFGKQFARAYEQIISELADRPGGRPGGQR